MKYILIIFIIIISIYILLTLIGKKYENPYKLIMIFGKKGSGKTTYFTKLSIKYNKKGYDVYSNVPIYGAKLFNINDFGIYQFPEDSVILIDEVKMIWDSRNFKSFKDYVRDYFILQRHHKNIIYLASQQFNIDKSIRDLCDELYLMVNYFNVFSVAKKINKRITIHNGDEDNESFLTEDYSFSFLFNWHFTFIPRYKYFFDSFEHNQLINIPSKDISTYSYFNEYISNNINYIKYLIAILIQRINNRININNLILHIKFMPNRIYISNLQYTFLLWALSN